MVITTNSAIIEPPFLVRHAQGEEVLAGRYLFSESFLTFRMPDLFFAFDNANELAGATSLFVSPDIHTECAMRCEIKLLPTYSKYSELLANILLESIRNRARDCYLDAVYSTPLASSHSATDMFRDNGFSAHSNTLLFNAGLDRLMRATTNLLNRIRSRKSDINIQVVPYAQASKEDLNQIYHRVFSMIPIEHENLYEENNHGLGCFDCSRAVIINNRVSGCLLVSREGDSAHIYRRVVLPEHHGGIANLFLLVAVCEALMSEGVERVTFECEEDNRDTIKLAKRMQAKELEPKIVWRYALAG